MVTTTGEIWEVETRSTRARSVKARGQSAHKEQKHGSDISTKHKANHVKKPVTFNISFRIFHIKIKRGSTINDEMRSVRHLAYSTFFVRYLKYLTQGEGHAWSLNAK